MPAHPLLITFSDIFVRLIAAAALGAILGLEREIHNKPAGLRTLMLVALGAAGFVLIGLQFVQTITGAPAGATDASRIIAGVMQGIGFLGAGAVVQQREFARGVTTAASIWVVGALGAACGFGTFQIAVVIGIMAFLILTVFGYIEHRFWPQKTVD